MEEKETADKAVYPSLPKEQNVEETHEMVDKHNTETPADDSIQYTGKVQPGAALPSVRLVTFLFWSNFAAVLLLLVGFVAPGWLTLTTNQRLTYFSTGSDQHINDVYQDYALWYVSQCYEHDGRNIECETMTYRSIAGAYKEDGNSFEKLKIGSLENEGEDKFMFHGAALVIGHSKVTQIQTLYTIGLLISFVLLQRWYALRKDVVKGDCKGCGKWMWIFLILLTVLAVVLVFIDVFTFVGVTGELGEYNVELDTSFGLLFAVFGGVLLIVVGFAELIQTLCCLTVNNPE